MFAKRPLVAVPAGLFLIGLAVMIYLDPPMRRGNAAHFWEAACGVETSGYQGQGLRYARGTYPRTDGWNVYFSQQQHDRPLYRVAQDEVEGAMREVVALLPVSLVASKDRPCAQAGDFCERLLAVKNKKRQACLSLYQTSGSDASTMLEKLSGQSVVEGTDEALGYFRTRWAYSKYIWAVAAAEFIYLMTWWLLTIAPRLWPQRALNWRVHLGLSPLVIVLPSFVGYADLYTTAPSGSILYGIVAMLALAPAVAVLDAVHFLGGGALMSGWPDILAYAFLALLSGGFLVTIADAVRLTAHGVRRAASH